MKIRIKYFDGAEKLEKLSVGDWIDLRANKDVCLLPEMEELIPLGIAMELPKGYEAWVVPRSSTFRKYGIIMTNNIGIIDEKYCGPNDEWHFPAYATKTTMIKKGDRICQFRIMEHQPEIEFEESDLIGNDDRGGFGSTGR